MHVYLHRHARVGGVWGHTPLPKKKNFQINIGCSEIASEAIVGQKQSRSSCMACGVLHRIFGCPCMHLLRQLTRNLYEGKNYGWQNSRRGDVTIRTVDVERLK